MTETETRALYDRFLDFLKTNPGDIEMDMFFDAYTEEQLDAINFLLEHAHKKIQGIYLRQTERRWLYGTGDKKPLGIL